MRRRRWCSAVALGSAGVSGQSTTIPNGEPPPGIATGDEASSVVVPPLTARTLIMASETAMRVPRTRGRRAVRRDPRGLDPARLIRDPVAPPCRVIGRSVARRTRPDDRAADLQRPSRGMARGSESRSRRQRPLLRSRPLAGPPNPNIRSAEADPRTTILRSLVRPGASEMYLLA